jgi:hypothetical protein
VITLK